MITFTEMKAQAAANCGLYPDAPEMKKVSRDINNGIKLFHNAARRYWTKDERDMPTQDGQARYKLPGDVLRVSSVRFKRGNWYDPLTQIESEDEWHEILRLASPNVGSSGVYFIGNSNTIELYPAPSESLVDGLKITYEPKMVDLAIEDMCLDAEVTHGSQEVKVLRTEDGAPSLNNSCYLKIEDGFDGIWYKIDSATDEIIALETPYEGKTSDSVSVIIGQAPSFPEEYHEAPVHYACQQFFTLRKDLESASFHGQQFDKLFQEYRTTYGNKTTGGVINPRKRQQAGRINSWPGVLGA